MQSDRRPSLVPASVIALRDYSPQKFLKDLIAGLTVGLVALPLAMAFAISSGVPPQAGIYTAIIAGFIISALGGSRTQIGGPTGAFVVVVSGIIAQHGIDGLFMTTFCAGILLILLGITGLGQAVKFIPRPVIVGFTNGIAVLIASTQIKDYFGLEINKVPGDFLPRMFSIADAISTINITATILATTTIAIIVLVNKFISRIPGTIIALFALTAVAVLVKLPVETIHSKFGAIPTGLPQPILPQFRLELLTPLSGAIITVTMLGAIESLLSAVVSDRMTGQKHNPNAELVAQGIANVASPIFGGLPATGAIARTATNIRSGAQSPVAGIIHALVLLIIVLFAAPLAEPIPLAVLAGILMVVSYNMGEWREIPFILKSSRADAAVWAITFGLTVFADLTIAVEAGMILAALLFIGRISSTTTVTTVDNEYIESGYAHSLQHTEIPTNVSVLRIHGPFLFGTTDKLQALESQIPDLKSTVILRLRNMTALDATGVHALEDFTKKVEANDKTLILCGALPQPARLIEQSSLPEILTPANICPDFVSAIERAKSL